MRLSTHNSTKQNISVHTQLGAEGKHYTNPAFVRQISHVAEKKNSQKTANTDKYTRPFIPDIELDLGLDSCRR